MWICHSEFQVTTWISRIELNCSRFHQTAANFRDARLPMISGMWRDHEIINDFNASLSAQQDKFQMDSFLFCRQMDVYNSSFWLWLPFPCFLAINFWANKMEICTIGNLLMAYCICLLNRHYNLPAWWIYPLWMEWELQVLGVDSNYVPVANDKVKTYTYKAVQLHVSRRMNLTHLEPLTIPKEETQTLCHIFHWYVCFLISLESWIWAILAAAWKSPY
jgi:hypothetical protein